MPLGRVFNRKNTWRLLAATALSIAMTNAASAVDLRDPSLRGPSDDGPALEKIVIEGEQRRETIEAPATKPQPVLQGGANEANIDKADGSETPIPLRPRPPRPDLLEPAPVLPASIPAALPEVEDARKVTITPSAAKPEIEVDPAIALRSSDSEVEAALPDLTALTNAIPAEDVTSSFTRDVMDDGYTLSGPRRAESSMRALPSTSASMTILGRDLTGQRNPRRSTTVLLGR